MNSVKDNSAGVRQVSIRTKGIPTSDGAGVKLTRLIGTDSLNTLDPFLMLDVIESDENADYIGGFPSHPHRGFETVTYLLNGKVRHKDNAGHEGIIESGGVQWMTAGRGIVHSEMPEQEEGLLHGFQLWVNLPAKDKMTEAAYQELTKDAIPTETLNSGSLTKVIAGKTEHGTEGAVKNAYVNPQFFHVRLNADQVFEQAVKPDDSVFIYLIRGEVIVGDNNQPVKANELAVLENGHQISIQTNQDTEFLFLAAQPLNEPIARGGPFVMNTKEQVLQAFEDFQSNQF